MKNDDLYQEILERLKRMKYIRATQIPNIDLYMDQVTHFMDAHLSSEKRHKEDKILTKTMINNYAKNNLLPPPVKKKYSKEHMILLLFIYYYKCFLSINDIHEILKLVDEHFHPDLLSEPDLSSIYTEVFSFSRVESQKLIEDVTRKYELSKTAFQNAPEESKERLQLFAWLGMLGHDVYLKKQIMETIIDQLSSSSDSSVKK